MRKARLITIGTEITAGEVVNANAAWVSTQLEDKGVRVFSHLSVRDQRDEIARALASCDADDIVVVTGGLGPTSDDMTRECMATYFGVPLEFDASVWSALEARYLELQLPLREAHRHQCYFPAGSVRLPNRAGTALGFAYKFGAQDFFVLPGPPRELENMWKFEVEHRLVGLLPATSFEWVRWTCLGAPESEVAEIVEPLIAGRGLEVGYRAQVPYVKVKIYADRAQHADVIAALETALSRFIVARGLDDLAEEFLSLWPSSSLWVHDTVTASLLFQRLVKAKSRVQLGSSLDALNGPGLSLRANGEEFVTELRLPDGRVVSEHKTLPYRIALDSERGRRSAVEWAIWFAVRALRKTAAHP